MAVKKTNIFKTMTIYSVWKHCRLFFFQPLLNSWKQCKHFTFFHVFFCFLLISFFVEIQTLFYPQSSAFLSKIDFRFQSKIYKKVNSLKKGRIKFSKFYDTRLCLKKCNTKLEFISPWPFLQHTKWEHLNCSKVVTSKITPKVKVETSKTWTSSKTYQ